MANVPVILLAAGSSSRMKQPKQLLPWGNQTLIEFQLKKLLNAGNPVFVVLGAHSNAIVPIIRKFDVNFTINVDWEKGMGTSIASGIQNVMEYFPLAEGALITLVDQPMVTLAHFQNMYRQFRPGKQEILVSQSSSGWIGVPTLFDKFYFNELSELKGAEGARKVFQKYPGKIIPIDCQDQTEDMDTPERYQQMLENWRKTNR